MLQPDETGRRSTVFLAFLAAVQFQTLRLESKAEPSVIAAQGVSLVALCLVVSWCRRRYPEPFRGWAGAATVALFAVMPFAWEAALRALGRPTDPMELMALGGIEHACLALAVLGGRRRQRLSCLLSGFLVLFVTAITTRWLSFAVAALYTAGLLWWLMGAYWDRLRPRFVAAEVRRQTPLRALVLGGMALLVLAVGALVGANSNSVIALAGFLPTSGGDRWHDPAARAGVGDGDMMLAAKDEAQSFGPVESELFLESHMPTLYDMFNDMYGEPPVVKKNAERAVALDPVSQRPPDHDIARTQRDGREFSAVRRRGERRNQPLENRDAPAMLYLVGPAPTHLALESFDAFDGVRWTAGDRAALAPALWVENSAELPWIRWRKGGHAVLGKPRSHLVKIINLKSPRVPTPPLAVAVHIDKIDRTDFFGFTADGGLHMPGRDHVPQLTVLHLRSHAPRLQSLRVADFRPSSAERGPADPGNPGSPAGLSEVVRARAEGWTRGVPAGWLTVEAVVSRLRREFVHDPAATAPPDCTNVVEHFLRNGRGPDYLFATTAAVMLRHLGYPVRLTAGFYAHPERYSRAGRQTAILKEDVHVWPEVRIGEDLWLPIEPTPGFEPPAEDRGWLDIARGAARAAWAWMARHFGAVSAALATALLLVLFRRTALDGLATACWWLFARGPARRRVDWTLWLLECRARLAGRARPPSRTLADWYAPLVATAGPGFAEFFSMAARALYAPGGIDGERGRRARTSCRAAAAAGTRRRMRAELARGKQSP